MPSQSDAFCTLQGVFGYYHCGLECFRKQIIRWALKVKDDSGYLGRKMSASGLRNGSSTGKKAEQMYQVCLQSKACAGEKLR